MWSGSCIVWSCWPICRYWQWDWGRNPVSRPVPVKQAAFFGQFIISSHHFHYLFWAHSHHLYTGDIDSVDNTVLCISKAHCIRLYIVSILLASMLWSHSCQILMTLKGSKKLQMTKWLNYPRHIFSISILHILLPLRRHMHRCWKYVRKLISTRISPRQIYQPDSNK